MNGPIRPVLDYREIKTSHYQSPIRNPDSKLYSVLAYRTPADSPITLTDYSFLLARLFEYRDD